MKTNHLISSLLLFLILATSVVAEGGTPVTVDKKKALSLSRGDLSTSAGGSGIVVAYFGRKKKSCIKGFGICKLFPKPRKDFTIDEIMSMVAESHENFYALFKLKGDLLTIKFLEEIPHFQEKFFVDEPEPPFEPVYKNLLGYEYIKPVVGVYKADKNIGKYGGVRIKVEKGKKLE